MHLPHLPKVPHLNAHREFHRVRDAAHTLYFAMAFLEGHSMYAYTAGGLFVMCCIGFVMKEEV